MPYRKTVEKGDESSEGMRWPSVMSHMSCAASSSSELLCIPLMIPPGPPAISSLMLTSPSAFFLQDLEKEWDEHTLPDLRAIIAWKMDVTPDSGLIQHNPSCDVEYK